MRRLAWLLALATVLVACTSPPRAPLETLAPSGASTSNAPSASRFLVFEAGSRQLTLVEGDDGGAGAGLRVLRRIGAPGDLLPGGQASPDGRYLYAAAQDGWVRKFDLWQGELAAQVQVSPALTQLALSSDGRFLAAASDAPPTLLILSADLQPIKQLAVETLDGKHRSRIAALRDAPPRRSFVAALADVAEVWEIAYNEGAAAIFDGYVHDYRMGEAIAKPGFLNPRRTPLEIPLADFAFDAGHHHLLAAERRAGAEGAGPTVLQIVNLDARRKIAQLSLAGHLQPSGGTRLTSSGQAVFAASNRAIGAVEVIDLRRWKPLRSIATPGPGRFVASQDNTRHLWADASLAPAGANAMTLIDKESLAPAATLSAPGLVLSQVQFSRDGRSALVLAEGSAGALIAFDTATLRETSRLPMAEPQWLLRVPAPPPGR